jgi:hypothetical protein
MTGRLPPYSVVADSAARHAWGNETRNREKMWGESVLLFCVTKGNVTLPDFWLRPI